jgi:short-subunit dehydrogenase
MTTNVDRERFGPWALITGASSGIGREFARQLAAAGLNTVLVARRLALVEEAGHAFAREFGVEYRAIGVDLSQEGFLKKLAEATDDLDIGLVVSNAGTGSPGALLSKDRAELASLLRLNSLAHLEIAHHFGKKLVARGRGGLLFVGAMGSDRGIPYMANDAAAKAYVQSLAQGLHVELKPLGVQVTVLPVGPTETPVLAKLGLTPESMPMKPMKTEQCVCEGLKALQANRPMIIPGRLNRIMNAIIPASITRAMMAKMFTKALANRPAAPHPQAEMR